MAGEKSGMTGEKSGMTGEKWKENPPRLPKPHSLNSKIGFDMRQLIALHNYAAYFGRRSKLKKFQKRAGVCENGVGCAEVRRQLSRRFG